MKKIFTLAYFIFGISFLQAQIIKPIWERTEATNGTDDFKRLPIVFTDTFHNVIVCGETYNAGSLIGFVTTKYDSTGNFLWQRRYDTAAHDYIRSAAVDNTGAVYVGGSTTNPFNNNQTKFIVIKYADNGDTLWQYSYGTFSSGYLSPSALLLDSVQNLLICADFVGTPSVNSGMLVAKLDPNGNIIWEKVYNEGSYGYGGIAAKWVGDHVVYWGRTGSPEGQRFFVWQISDGGETIATAVTEPFDASPSPQDRGYHIDQFGNFFVGTLYYKYKVTKFRWDATIDWVYDKPIIFPPPIPGHINLQCIASDTLGNVYVAGLHSDSFGLISITTKLGVAGEFLWEHKMAIDGSINIPNPNSCKWLNEHILLVTGTIRTNVDSNFYEPFLLFFDKDGPIKKGISDIEGKRNDAISIASDGNYFYVTGIATPIITVSEPSKQFLCKYALDDIVTTTSLVRDARTVGQLSLSPNPFLDKFRVSVNHAGEASSGVLKASDSQGNTIFQKEVSLTLGDNHFDVGFLSETPAGIYVISLLTSKQLYAALAVKAM